MTKRKIQIPALIGLLVANLILLVFVMIKPGKANPEEGPKRLIIKELHLRPAQVARYEKMILAHRAKIDQCQEGIQAAKGELYSSISDNIGPDSTDFFLKKISHYQTEIERIHLQHFQDIQKLCDRNQLIYFEHLSGRLASLFAHKPPKKH